MYAIMYKLLQCASVQCSNTMAEISQFGVIGAQPCKCTRGGAVRLRSWRSKRKSLKSTEYEKTR